jgi:hypothetical protein
MSTRSLSLTAIPVALVLALLLALVTSLATTSAGEICADFKGELCLTLTPDPDTNPVGTDHTVTAVMTLDGDPLKASATETLFFVLSGPNAGETAIEPQVESATSTFTYTGSGGVGTDEIVAIACEPGFCEDIQSCLESSPLCIEKVEAACSLTIETPGPVGRVAAGGGKGGEFCFGPATAEKTWEDPTPTPSPTPVDVGAGGQAPSPTPAQLPQSGGEGGDSGSPWFAVALAIAALGAAAFTFFVIRRQISTQRNRP